MSDTLSTVLDNTPGPAPTPGPATTPEPTAPAAADAAPSLLAKLGAEAFGTFVLVLVGVGVALWAGVSGVGGGVLAAALAFGIAVMAGAAAVGHLSGGHFNPAVTLGSAVAGRTPWRDVLPYWLAQLIGGAFAAAILFILTSSLSALDGNERAYFSGVSTGFGEHSPIAAQAGAGFSLLGALVIEVVVTAVFVTVILGVTRPGGPAHLAPVVIGLTLSALLLVAIPVTNGSINPARSTATALFSEAWALEQLWVFWVAPLVGAAIAGAVAFLLAPGTAALSALEDSEDIDEPEAADPDAAAETDQGEHDPMAGRVAP